MVKFKSLSVEEFLKRTSSSSPTPGGGTASAMMGALGASLIKMVAELTVGKKKYEEVWEEMRGYSGELQKIVSELEELMDEDAAAFDGVMAAFSLPKESEEEKEVRRRAIQEAFKRATEVPLKTARTALRALEMAPTVAEKGNKNSISDVGVGALACRGAVEGAILNVMINVPAIKDEEFKERSKREAEEIARKAEELYKKAIEIVNGELGA